jgi:hypothetical protein
MRLRLVHYHSFLTVSHLPDKIIEFYSRSLSSPTHIPGRTEYLTTFSPSKQSFLVHRRPALIYATGCSVIDICPTPEPKREPTPPPRTTYTVKVHERTVISRTEFPNAIPSLVTPTNKGRPKSVPLPTTDPDSSDDESIGPSTTKRPTITPRDQNRLMRLRQDPSVVSLLNMYDSHGRLDNKAFSNSPVKDDPSEEEQVYAVGRPQHQRRGSTLRQLMGKPSLRRNQTIVVQKERFPGRNVFCSRCPWTTKRIAF